MFGILKTCLSPQGLLGWIVFLGGKGKGSAECHYTLRSCAIITKTLSLRPLVWLAITGLILEEVGDV